MKFLKIFISTLVSITLVIILSYYFATQGRLFLATWKLQADVKSLQRLVVNPKPEHFEACTVVDEEDIFADVNQEQGKEVIKGYQLAFTNDREYQIEVVCRDASKDTFVIQNDRLFHGVTKRSGSGYFLPYPPSQRILNSNVIIGLGAKLISVSFQNDKVETASTDATQIGVIGNSPAITSCEGWQKSCCNPRAQAGQGELQDFVVDCPSSCYDYCLEKPFIVYLTTDPGYNPTTREIYTRSSAASVDISYRIDDLDSRAFTASIDFGDGQILTNQPVKQIISHSYTCQLARCVYTIKIGAEDSEGLPIAESDINQVTVILEP